MAGVDPCTGFHCFTKTGLSFQNDSGMVLSLLNLMYLIYFQIDSFDIGLKTLPIFYAFTIAINFFSVFYKGSHGKKQIREYFDY